MDKSKLQNNSANANQDIHQQALVDLFDRARAGSFMYPLLWVFIAVFSSVFEMHLLFFIVNFSIFMGIAIARFGMTYINIMNTSHSVATLTKYFEIIIILQGAHFGLVVAQVHYIEGLESLRYPLILSGAGIVAAGTATLALSQRIRQYYPVVLMLPYFLLMLLGNAQEGYLVSGVIIMFTIYLFVATKPIHFDYWNSIRNRFQLEEKAEKLEHLSSTDHLTKLHNRMFFDHYFEQQLKTATDQRVPLSVLVIDLDHFKLINDSLGHTTGDECLREASRRLSQCIQRPNDLVARYGGEEFIVLLTNTDVKGASSVAENILNAFRNKHFVSGDETINLRCSIGLVSNSQVTTQTTKTLITCADEALYDAKAAGRNCFRVYTNKLVS